MKRNLVWLVVVLLAARFWARPTNHRVTARGIAPGMSPAQVRALLGNPEQITEPDWHYRKLKLGIDFVGLGYGKSVALRIYSPTVEVDGNIVWRVGTSASEIRKVLGRPEIDHLDWLRYQVDTGVLDVGLDHRTQLVEWFRLREKPKWGG